MATSNTWELSVNIPIQVSPADDPEIESDEHAPIVLDNGSSTIKVGFAGEDAPQSVVPSVVLQYSENETELIYSGFTRESFRSSDKISVDITRLIKDYGPNFKYFGNAVESYSPHRTSQRLSRPVASGIIEKWDEMTEMWRYIMDSQLSINTADHSILVTEPVLNPKANREKTGQIMFESLHFSNFFLSQQDVLALFASGRTTGVSLCCGHDQMWSTPIYEGYCEPHAVLRSGFGGRQLTQYIMDSSDQSLSEKVARDMKEKLCYIALDSEKVSTEKRMYKMPDGKDIEMNNKVLSQCGEALFSPQIIGIEHQGLGHMVYNSVMKTSVSIRRDLFSNLVVHGGTSLIQGMEQRLQKEVESPNAYNTRMINVIAPPERKYSSWIGGSILGSLSTFQEMWITKQEYQESGPSIIHRKAL